MCVVGGTEAEAGAGAAADGFAVADAGGGTLAGVDVVAAGAGFHTLCHIQPLHLGSCGIFILAIK